MNYSSSQAVLGTSPISCSAPAEGGDSFVLDMATSTVSHGKVRNSAEASILGGGGGGGKGSSPHENIGGGGKHIVSPPNNNLKNSQYVMQEYV